MKNEERILELLAETLQRIDRHSEEIERLNKKFDRHSEQFDRHSELIQLVVSKLQAHDSRLDKHEDALIGLKERTEAIHQSSLEQQKAYQAMTELLMYHNQALREKEIL